MELFAQKKLNAHIFRLLKVNEIVIPIGRTNKGNLGIKFQENSDDFEIYLDAVPLRTINILEDENNIELKKMLEKYLFDDIRDKTFSIIGGNLGHEIVATSVPEKKVLIGLRRGRPKGSKNKTRDLSKEPETTGEVVG